MSHVESQWALARCGTARLAICIHEYDIFATVTVRTTSNWPVLLAPQYATFTLDITTACSTSAFFLLLCIDVQWCMHRALRSQRYTASSRRQCRGPTSRPRSPQSPLLPMPAVLQQPASVLGLSHIHRGRQCSMSSEPQRSCGSHSGFLLHSQTLLRQYPAWRMVHP